MEGDYFDDKVIPADEYESGKKKSRFTGHSEAAKIELDFYAIDIIVVNLR